MPPELRLVQPGIYLAERPAGYWLVVPPPAVSAARKLIHVIAVDVQQRHAVPIVIRPERLQPVPPDQLDDELRRRILSLATEP